MFWIRKTACVLLLLNYSSQFNLRFFLPFTVVPIDLVLRPKKVAWRTWTLMLAPSSSLPRPTSTTSLIWDLGTGSKLSKTYLPLVPLLDLSHRKRKSLNRELVLKCWSLYLTDGCIPWRLNLFVVRVSVALKKSRLQVSRISGPATTPFKRLQHH